MRETPPVVAIVELVGLDLKMFDLPQLCFASDRCVCLGSFGPRNESVGDIGRFTRKRCDGSPQDRLLQLRCPPMRVLRE